MSEFLHLAAVAPAGVAACCVASGRSPGRGARRLNRIVEVVVAVLMLAAMLDVVRPAPLLAPVLWAALLLVGALALAVTMRHRTRSAGGDPDRFVLAHGSIHGALGCIVMAALVMVMVAPEQSVGVSHHGTPLLGASASVLAVVIGAGVLAYAAYSFAALRHGDLRERIQFAAMGLSTLGMAAAVLL